MSFMHSGEEFALAKAISRLLGWSYFACWSLSFYPQPYYNYTRNSTKGFAIDFPTLNVLGFGSYTFSTAAFLWSSAVREQYARRHIDSPEPTVRLNDFAFAAHGFVLCAITYSQFFPSIWGIQVDRRQRASRVVLGIVFGSLVAIALSIILVLVSGSKEKGVNGWEWLDVVYTLGYVKLICTIVKYCPQAYLNYKRQSTVGWSISQILLDFSGGILSLLQLMIDCALQADWGGTWGNIPKLGLSNISLFFDVVFIIQHYILYRSVESPPVTRDQNSASENDPLLPS